jgi:amino acid adenylation domain-containing protein
MPVKTTLTPSAKKLELLEALLIEEGLHEAGVRVPVQEDRSRFVTSFMQQRLWFLDQMEPGAATYNVYSAVRLEGHLDLALLERSLNAVVQRHETLRTRFDLAINGQPEQIVLPTLRIHLHVVQVPNENGKSRGDIIAELIRAEASKPFDLKNGPLFRTQLLQVNPLEHVALFTMHHMICDGWSQGVLVNDLTAFYAAYAQGREPQLPPLQFQYGDYAEWQRARLQGEVLEKELDYWRKELANFSGVLEMPTDRPRPAVQTYRGAHHDMKLSPGLTRRLNDFARRENVTLYMVLLASVQVLLCRYSGQDDIAVGTPIANRPFKETENLIGFFANTLVMRSRLQAEESFRSFLKRVQQTALGSYAHQEMPFEKLVDDLNPERDLSRSPLFQTMFVLQNAPNHGELIMPGLRLALLPSDNNTAKFDLLFGLEQGGAVLQGGIEYATDLFDQSTIARLGGHWITLLESMVARPASPIADLPLLSAQERQEIVFDWNHTDRQYSREKTIVGIIEDQVEKAPQVIAVVFEGRCITYAELNSRSNQLAHFLRKKGLSQEHLVGVCMERSVEMVVALLGILKAGAAYVPLDASYPPDRLTYMLEDADVRLLLTQQHLAPILAELNSEMACLDRDWNLIAGEPARNPVHSLSGENLAYVIYTSGSTGRPKGAMNRHDGIRNRLQWMQEMYRLDESDRVLQKTPFSFDVSVWEFFWPLMAGARLVVAAPGGHQDPAYLAKLIQQEGITTIHFVPSMLQVFIEEPQAEQCKSLRRVICSGEALGWNLQERFHHRMAGVELHNLYGPTEAAVDVTWWKCERGSHGFTVPLGYPIANIQIHILDKRLEPTPVGVAGEIHIAGIGLGRGYWQKAELTAEKFIPHPFSGEPGQRLYKTGDLGRVRPNGVIEYLGRLDHQVKIRGFRIELGEIEAALSAHKDVREAVVIAQEDGGNKKLVAYVVLQNVAGKASVELLQRYLREQLPEYMVPGIVVELESMPLFPNGKLDRNALPKAGVERKVVHAPSRTPDEKVLAAIWSEVLKIERVGIDENFFTLGGDSILSIQVRARAQMAGLNFSLQDLFRYQTIRELARHRSAAVQEHPPKTEPFSLVSEEDRRKLPDSLEDAYPLATLQSGMLFHMEFAPPGSVMYHNVNSYHVRGPWMRETFLDAVQRVTARHPALRTSFDFHSFSVPLQLVHRSAYFPVEEEDLRALSEEQQQAALAEFMVSARLRRFDLSKPPQLRFHVHRRSEDRFQFTFTENHAIIDGWSLHATLAEVFELYVRLLAGERPVAEVAPRTSYRDFVAMERLETESEEHRSFWTIRISDSEFVPLPDLTSPSQKKKEPRTIIRSVPVSRETSDGLKQLSQTLGVPIKNVLLAGHMKAMAVATGSRDVVSGLVANGRLEVEDGDQVRGLFLNTVPFRLMISEGTWNDLITRTFSAENEMLPHRRYPLALIQRNVGTENLFDNYFNFAHFHVIKNLLESDGIEILGGDKYESSNFKLFAAFSLGPTASRDVWLELQYDDSRIAEEQIGSITQYYLRIFDAMAANAQQPHETLSLLSQAEQAQLLQWNETRRSYLRNQGMASLVDLQARKNPDAVAVIFEGQSLPYGELNRRAGQLAAYLQSKGARPEALVGICMERSLELMVALLAVLKTGAAYVPLDPGYPQERLRYMMEDAHLTLVLSQERLLSVLPFADSSWIWLDRDWHAIASQAALEQPQYEATGDNLAYVMYTSGSTGKPKGVMVRQSSLSNFVTAMNACVGDQVPQRWLAVTSVCFDISVLELIWPLTHGFQVVLHPGNKASDSDSLLNQIERHGITHLQCTPSTMSLIMSNRAAHEVLKGLKRLMLGGESLPLALAQDLQRNVGCDIINLYGPTETTVWSTSCLLQPDVDVVTIGRPIANTQIHILDSQLDRVPVGTTGEIYIGGDGMARGYFAKPDLTAERFIPDIFSVQPGDWLYRTGDLGRYRADGAIEYVGRVDQQVKIRGRRSELSEIEIVVASHEAVREAAVVVQQDGGGVKRLVGYVVLKEFAAESQKPTGPEIRDYVRSKLPDYMVPAVIVELDRMPLTPNGKLNRKSLPKPQGENWGLRNEYVAPRTGTQEVLAQIWSGVLGVERVGIKDNFFDLGGHSLLATQLIARVRNAFQIEVPLNKLFEQTTVEKLSQSIEEALRGGRENPVQALPLVRRTVEEKKRLSFAQQRLWFMNLFEPGSAFYNLPAALVLEGELNVAALHKSLNEVVQRHEILRTRFDINAAGEPEQFVMEALSLELPVIEIGGETEQDKFKIASRLAIEEASRPFNLKTGPLIRASLLRIAPSRHVVLFTLHHIVSDEWSQGILIEEVGAFYTAFAQDAKPAMRPLAIQYGDYAAWQREMLQGEVLQKQLHYWRGQLGGMNSALALPTDRPRPPVQTFAGQNYRVTLDAEVGRRARELARQESATVYMVLLAAFNVLLWRYSGQKDIVVGTPIANRTREETENLIGFFVNNLVLRTEIQEHRSFLDLVRKVREITLGAYAHQDISFEKLVEELNPERDLSRSPLFQVLFTLQNASRRPLAMPGLKVHGIEAENLTSKFDLTMFVTELPSGELESVMEYNTDLFNQDTIARMAGHWQMLVRGVVTGADGAVGDLPFLTAAERHQIVAGWNQTRRTYPREETLLHLFEEDVKKYPNHLAVVFEEKSLSFAALNRQANQLARYLQSKGVGPERLVGICMERGMEMMVGLLGIWKAGGAYVPMDPAYPASRLKHMVDDCGAQLLLTQERLAAALPQTSCELVYLDRDWPQVARYSEENLEVPTDPENLAYVIYTSGSTGRPKGVMVRHGNLVNFGVGMDDCLAPRQPGTWLAVTSLSFDISVLELLWTLSRGFRVIIQAGGVAGEVEPVLEQIVRHEVTHFQCTPSMAGLLLLHPKAESALGRLQKMLVGGENLPLHLGQRLKPMVGGQLINMYGPTETVIWSSSWALPEDMATVAIGSPLANTQLYILDERMEPLPVGATGELYIGGDGVARGYLTRPELTAERFVPDHLSHASGERLYRTGDLTKYRADGTIEYLGRVDQQIKLRGHRIELGEIESVLAAHEMVREAAVVVRDDAGADRQLVGYIVWKAATEDSKSLPGTDSLREFLRGKLPDYMVPAVIVELDQMPLTPNGKLDRRALPKPQGSMRRQRVEFVAARNELENKIAGVWQNILQLEQAGIHDNFFDLGGHSLLLARLSMELHQALGRDISVVDLFRYPSIAAFAGFLAQTQTQADVLKTDLMTEKLEAGKDRLKQLANRRRAAGAKVPS